MPWLRLYTDILHSRKIQMLPDGLFRHWVNLLCIAKLHDGSLPNDDEIAWHLRIQKPRVQSILDQLTSRGLLDDRNGFLQPHDWDEHQFQADVSSNRVKRFRERKVKRRETVSRNAPETEQIQSRTDTEQKIVSSIDSPAEELIEILCSNHPKKGDRTLAEHAVSDLLGKLSSDEQGAVALRIMKSHGAWCSSNGWQENGGKFAPKLSNWLREGGWRDMPPQKQSQSEYPER